MRALSCAAAGAPLPALPHTLRMRGACDGIGGRAFRGKGTSNRGKRANRAFHGCSLARPTGTSRRWARWGQCFMVGCGTQRNCAEGVR